MKFRERAAGVLLAAVGVLILALFLHADRQLIRATTRQLRAAHFPAAQGVITHNQRPDTRDDDWVYDIRYGYEVAGRSYTGCVYRHTGRGARFGWYNDIDQEFPVGRAVTVYYNPYDPADAVLLPGVGGYDLVQILARVSAYTPILLLLYCGWLGLRGRHPVPLRLRHDGGVTRVRLDSCTPALVVGAACVWGLWTWFAAFVYPPAAGHTAYPPLWVGVVAWAVALAPLPLIVRWLLRYHRSPRRELVRDDRRGVVALPSSHWRDEAVLEVPRDSVRSVTLTDVVRVRTDRAGRPGKREDYLVSVECQAGGEVRKEYVHTTGDADHADRVAQWLGRFLNVPCRRAHG